MRFNQITSTMEEQQLGTEDQNLLPEVTETVVDSSDLENTDADEGSNSSADDQAQMNELSTELQEDDSQVNQAGQNVIDLSNAAQVLNELEQQASQTVTETGSISPTSAKVIETTLESIRSKLGIEIVSLPSSESFKGKWTANEASRLTVESIMEVAKTVFAKLMAAIEFVIQTVGDFLVTIFRNRAILEKKLLAQIQRVKGVTSTTFISPELSGEYVDTLCYRGNTNISTILKITNTADISISQFGRINSIIQNIRDDKDVDPGVISEFFDLLFLSGQVKTEFCGRPIDAAGAFVNGESFAVVSCSSGQDEALFLPNGVSKGIIMKALSPGEITVILNAALSTIRNLRKIESTSDTLMNAAKNVLKSIKYQYNSLRGSMGSDDHAAKAKLYESGKALQSCLSKLIGKLPGKVFSACLGIYNLSEKCINNIK